MAETKWTPGPWEAQRISKQEIEIGAETPLGHLSVAWVHLGADPCPVDVACGLADAQMLAAATDLYDSLAEIVAKWGYPNTPRWHRARAALAKARGES